MPLKPSFMSTPMLSCIQATVKNFLEEHAACVERSLQERSPPASPDVILRKKMAILNAELLFDHYCTKNSVTSHIRYRSFEALASVLTSASFKAEETSPGFTHRWSISLRGQDQFFLDLDPYLPEHGSVIHRYPSSVACAPAYTILDLHLIHATITLSLKLIHFTPKSIAYTFYFNNASTPPCIASSFEEAASILYSSPTYPYRWTFSVINLKGAPVAINDYALGHNLFCRAPDQPLDSHAYTILRRHTTDSYILPIFHKLYADLRVASSLQSSQAPRPPVLPLDQSCSQRCVLPACAAACAAPPERKSRADVMKEDASDGRSALQDLPRLLCTELLLQGSHAPKPPESSSGPSHSPRGALPACAAACAASQERQSQQLSDRDERGGRPNGSLASLLPYLKTPHEDPSPSAPGATNTDPTTRTPHVLAAPGAPSFPSLEREQRHPERPPCPVPPARKPLPPLHRGPPLYNDPLPPRK